MKKRIHQDTNCFGEMLVDNVMEILSQYIKVALEPTTRRIAMASFANCIINLLFNVIMLITSDSTFVPLALIATNVTTFVYTMYNMGIFKQQVDELKEKMLNVVTTLVNILRPDPEVEINCAKKAGLKELVAGGVGALVTVMLITFGLTKMSDPAAIKTFLPIMSAAVLAGTASYKISDWIVQICAMGDNAADEAVTMELREMADESSKLATDPICEILGDPARIQQILSYMERRSKLFEKVKKDVDINSHPLVMSILSFSKNITDRITAVKTIPYKSVRQLPIAVLFHGLKGCGKTKLAQDILMPDIAGKLQYTNDLIYYIDDNKEQKYWTRYGNEKFAYVDDVFRSKDSVMMNRLHNMISHAPQIAQGAAVEEKEQLFRAPALFMTTNSSVENIDPNLKFSSNETKLAFWDRMIVIRVERPAEPRLAAYLEEARPTSREGYSFHLEMVDPTRVPRTVDVADFTLPELENFLCLKLKNTEIEFCNASIAMFEKHRDRCDPSIVDAALDAHRARLAVLRGYEFRVPQLNIPHFEPPLVAHVPRPRGLRRPRDHNASGHFNPCVFRFQGDPGSCKTKTVLAAAEKLAILTNLIIFKVKKTDFAPPKEQRPYIFLYDDVLEPKTYSHYLDFINSAHSRSLHLICSNIIIEPEKRNFIKAWATGSQQFTQFDFEQRHAGMIRRIGIPGELYDGKKHFSVPPNLAQCATSISATECIDYLSGDRFPSVQLPNRIIKFYANYLKDFSEFTWTQTMPELPAQFDFSLVTKDEADLQELLSNFSNLQKCFLGNERLGVMHVSPEIQANRSQLSFNNFVIKTDNLADIYETMTLFVREVRKAKLDATVCIKANGKSVIVIGNTFHTNFDKDKVVSDISDLADDDSFEFQFGEDRLKIVKNQLDSILAGEVLQFDDYDPLVAIAVELKVGKLPPKLTKYVSERTSRQQRDLTLLNKVFSFLSSTLGKVILGIISTLLAFLAVTKIYNYFTRDYGKQIHRDSNRRWDPRGPLSKEEYDKNAVLGEKYEEYLDTGRYTGDASFDVAYDTYNRMAKGRYDVDYNCAATSTNQSAHGAYLRATCRVFSNNSAHLHGVLIGRRLLFCPDHIRDDGTAWSAAIGGKTYQLVFVKKVVHKDGTLFRLPAQFGERKSLAWAFASVHDEVGVIGKGTTFSPGTSDFTQETGSLSFGEISSANPESKDRTEPRIGLTCNLANHAATFTEGLCGLPLTVRTRDGERILGFLTSTTGYMAFYTKITRELIQDFLLHDVEHNASTQKPIRIDQFLMNRVKVAERNIQNPIYQINDPETKVKIVGYLHPKKFKTQMSNKKVLLAHPSKAAQLPFAPSFTRTADVIDKSKLPVLHDGTGKLIETDLIYNQIRQYGIHDHKYNPDQRVMLKACIYLRDVYDHQYDTMRFLQISEAINGFYQPTSPYHGLLAPVAMDKSAGWRHKNLNKGIYVKGDCYVNVSQEGKPAHYTFKDDLFGQDLEQRVFYILRALADGVVVQSCAEACPKDEILPREKAKIGKIRTFIIPDHEMILVSRVLFGMLHANMIKHRAKGGCQMGIDPIVEFDRLYRNMAKFQDKGDNMDISRQDKHVRFEQRRKAVRIIAHLPWDLRGTEKIFGRQLEKDDVVRILDTFILTMKELLIHLPTGHVLLLDDAGVFSGEFFTTGFDSIDVELNNVYSTIKSQELNGRQMPPPERYRELVNDNVYGDDNKRNSDVAPIDPDFRKQCYAELGQTLVPIDKNDENLNDPFLSREPIEIEGRIIGRLKKSSLERALYYSNTTDCDIVTQAWLSVLSEASLYDKSYFGHIKAEMFKICDHRRPHFKEAEKKISMLNYETLRQTLVHISRQGRGSETDIYRQSNLINLIDSFDKLRTDYQQTIKQQPLQIHSDRNCSGMAEQQATSFMLIHVPPYDFEVFGKGGEPAYKLPYQDATTSPLVEYLMLDEDTAEIGYFAYGPSHIISNLVKIETKSGLRVTSEKMSSKKEAARSAYRKLIALLPPIAEEKRDMLRTMGWLPGTLEFTKFLTGDHENYTRWRELDPNEKLITGVNAKTFHIKVMEAVAAGDYEELRRIKDMMDAGESLDAIVHQDKNCMSDPTTEQVSEDEEWMPCFQRDLEECLERACVGCPRCNEMMKTHQARKKRLQKMYERADQLQAELDSYRVAIDIASAMIDAGTQAHIERVSTQMKSTEVEKEADTLARELELNIQLRKHQDKNCSMQGGQMPSAAGAGDTLAAAPVLNKPALGNSSGGGEPAAPMQAGVHTAAMEPMAPAMPMVNNETDTAFDSYQVQTMLPGMMANLGGMNKNTISLIEACGLPLETGTFVISSNDVQGKVLKVFEYDDIDLLHPYAQLYALCHDNFYGDIAVTMDLNGPPLQQGSVAFFYTNDVTPYKGLTNVATRFTELQLVYWRQISLANQQAITFIITDARQTAFFRDRRNQVAIPQHPGLVVAVYQPLQNQFATDTVFQVYVHMRGRFALAGETMNPYTVFQPVSIPRIQAAINALKGGLGPDPDEEDDLRSFLKINNSEPYYMSIDGVGVNANITIDNTYYPSPFRIPNGIGFPGYSDPAGDVGQSAYAPYFTSTAQGGLLLTHVPLLSPVYNTAGFVDKTTMNIQVRDIVATYIADVDYNLSTANFLSDPLLWGTVPVTEYVVVSKFGTTIMRMVAVAGTQTSTRWLYGAASQTDTPITADATEAIFVTTPSVTLPTGQARVGFSKCPAPIVQPTYRLQPTHMSDMEIIRGFDDRFYSMGGDASTQSLDVTVATTTGLSVGTIRYDPRLKAPIMTVGPAVSPYYSFIGSFDDLIVTDATLSPQTSTLPMYSADLFTSRSVAPFGTVKQCGGDRLHEPSSSGILKKLKHYDWNCMGAGLSSQLAATFIGSQPGATGEMGQTWYRDQMTNKQIQAGLAFQHNENYYKMQQNDQMNAAAKDLLTQSIFGMGANQQALSAQQFQQAKQMRGLTTGGNSYQLNYRGRGGMNVDPHSVETVAPQPGVLPGLQLITPPNDSHSGVTPPQRTTSMGIHLNQVLPTSSLPSNPGQLTPQTYSGVTKQQINLALPTPAEANGYGSSTYQQKQQMEDRTVAMQGVNYRQPTSRRNQTMNFKGPQTTIKDIHIPSRMATSSFA